MNPSACASKNPVSVNNEDIASTSSAYTESSSAVNTNQDLPESYAEAQAAAAALISTELNENWDQTDYPGKGNQGAIINQSLKTEHGQETVPKIPVSPNENGCKDKLTDSKDLENPEMSNRSDGTEDENTTNQIKDQVPENLTNQTKDYVPENLHKRNDAEETTELPKLNSDKDNTMGVYNEEQNSLKASNSSLCQVSASISGRESDVKIFSDNSEELLRHKNPMPVSETDQTFDSNQKESDKKVENAVTVGKRGPSQNQTVSTDCQAKWDKAKPVAKVPGTFHPSSQTSNIKDTPDNLKPGLPLASASENSNKDCQKLNQSETTKDQSQRLDNSKANAFTPTIQPATNVGSGNPHSSNTEHNFKVLERMNDANLKARKQCPKVNPSQASNTESLLPKPSFPLLPHMTADHSTHSQPNHLGQSLISGQTLSDPNRTLQPNIQRRSAVSSPLQMGTASYLDNSGHALSQNKFGSEIKPTNSVNLYNTNQNKTSTNQGPLNVIDPCSKFVPNNFKAPSLIRPGIQNVPQQLNQPTSQPVRLSTLPNNDKETLGSELRYSFPTATGINSGFSHNQRPCYTRYDAPPVQYAMYPDNGNMRRNSLCNRTSTMGNIANNNPLSIQRPGIYSVQPFQQNITRLGSPYLLMWPPPGDQITNTDKVTMTQPYSTPGIMSSYQQASKNILPNPVKDSHLYSTSTSTNDAKRCKTQFSDGGHNLLAGQQNPGERPSSIIRHGGISKQQEMLQSIPGTYNTIGQPIPPQQSEMFMNRGNDNTFPLSQKSIQRGQSSGYPHYQSLVGRTGNDLKVRLPNSSQSDPQFLAQNQSLGSHFQRPSYDQYQEFQHYYPGLPVPNANRCSLPDAIPPPKTQNMTSSNLQTGYAQRPVSSISSTQNPEIPTFRGQIMTSTTATIPTTSTTSLSSTKEGPKKTGSSIREGSSLDTGQHSGRQRFQNKIPELGVAHQGHALTKYPTQPNMANSSKLGTRFPAPDTNTIRPHYSKDAYATNKGQTFYSPSNSDSILTWSQYYPQNFDPTRPLHPSQRGDVNYDPLHGERNLTQFNFQLQNNVHSHFYASQSYNNYMQQVLPTFDTLQGTPRSQNSSNSVSTGSNFAATYHASPTGQNFENFRAENQAGVAGEKFHVLQDIPTSMAGDQVTWKAEGQDKKMGFHAQSETSGPKPADSEQFQNYNYASNLSLRAPERTAGIEKSTQILTPTTVAGSSTKTGDLLTKALSYPNLGMTSEESFLFSDFDPLFTSSLLTNDLDYFPENNSAFDQCFEDAASITMATATTNEARTQQSLDPVDPSQVPVSQQQQLTPLSNISGNISAGSSAPNTPFSLIHYNQIPPSRTGMESSHIMSHYNSGVAESKNLVTLTNKRNESILGYVPGANISTLSPKMGLGGVAKPSDVYPHDSILKRFSDLCTSKTASQLAKPISDYKSGKKWVNKRGTNLEPDETGTGIKKRNRQKRERPLTGLLPGEEAATKLKKKPAVPKGPPRPRGRPPKNKSLWNMSSATTQPVGPGLSINDANNANQTESLNIGTDAFEKNLPKPMSDFPEQVSMNYPAVSLEPELNMKNSSPPFPGCGNPSTEPEFQEDLVIKNPAGSNKSDDKISSNESSLVSEELSGNASSTTKTQRELSDREVIDAVTKCLESISRNEEKENSDQINECQLDENSENVDSSLDSSVLAGIDSQSGGDDIFQEDQALSREEMLMKAYIELKKKLEERMSRSLWRQSYLKGHEPKSNKAFRKLSKKECMTAYSGTTSWGPDDDLFSRYSNRSSTNSRKLVATADSTSTSIDSKLDKPTETSNQANLEVIDIELVGNLESVKEQRSDANDQLISSTEVSEPKDKTSRTGTTLRLPSMMEVVRTRLTDDLPSVDTSHPKPLAAQTSKEQPESPVPIESGPSERSESIDKSQNLEEEIYSNEAEQVENPESGDASNQQTGQPPPPAPRHPVLQPYSPSPLLPPPPPPPMPPQVIHFPSNREKKVTPRKVGPTIVENAKICFEAIRKYLTKADSDFDSFLISYANIVQGLLNCGADRYGRIKAILLNISNPESKEFIAQEDKKTTVHTAVNSDDPSAEGPLEFHRDIDASDIQGDSGRGENTIDVDDFSSSYADIVKVILSSRADEYRNIKQALSRNICGGTDVCQGPTKSSGKSRSGHEDGYEISIPVPTGCDEANGTPLAKANRKHGKKTQYEILENPAQVIKKQRKRKTQEEKKGALMKSKVVFNDETYATKTTRKRTPKRKLKKTQETLSTSKDRKRSSSGGSTKSSSFRIILSSNYFAEQSGKGSNLSVQSKKSGTSIEEDYEDAESRRPLSSDDGFVEESTGDYVMGLGSESGDEEKSSAIFHTEPLNVADEQTFGNMNNARSTKIVHNVQPKTLDCKPVSWYEAVFKTEKNSLSSDLNLNKEVDCEDSFSGGDPKITVEGFNVRDKVPTVNTEKHEEKKRQRPSRKAASAGVGAIRCPCGCCDDGSGLRDVSVENQLRDLTMSFKNRNRSKIIKPKSASIPKRRGRPRKIDKCPQKIISKLWTDISATVEEESRNTAKILSNYEEPSRMKMSEKLVDTFSLTSMSSQIPATRNDTIGDLAGRRELYFKLDSDSDSEEFSDSNVFMSGSGESDDSWKPKKSYKKGKRGTLKKKRRALAKYNLFHRNINDFIGVYDSRPDGTAQKQTEERQARKTESVYEEDESLAKHNPLNRNAASKSPTVTELTNESSLEEFNRDGNVSKTRISFKDFVPNLKLPPLPKIPTRNPETPNGTNLASENSNSPGSVQTIQEISKIFTRNDSNNKKEILESFKSLNREQNRIPQDAEDGGPFLSDNDAVCNNQMEVKVNHQRSQYDTSLQPKADDSGDIADVSKEGYFESIATESGNATSKRPKETSSSEERLRSLIEKITEINAATKRLDTECSASVESGSENIDKDSNGKDLQASDAGFGPKDGEGMRVKTELLERIDETIRCPIGVNDIDDSTSSSSDSSSQRSEGEQQRRGSMAQIQSLCGTLEVKMPSPLKSRKEKRNRTLKIQSVSFENKIIIRRTRPEKKNKNVRNLQKLMQSDKNIFDIMSQNETEDEERCFVGQDVKRGTKGSRDCLSYSPSRKSEVLSITSSGVNKSAKTKRSNPAGKSKMARTTKKAVKTNMVKILDSHSEKPSPLPQTEGPDRSPGFSENAKSSAENSLGILKKKKRKRIKANKSLLTEAKILVESDDDFNDTVSYSKEFHKNILPDIEITVDDSLGKKVGQTDGFKTKTKKLTKKSKTDVDVFGSKDNKVCLSFNVQKGKKRKKSLEPKNNLTLFADREKGNKEKLIVSGALRRNRKTKMDESSSYQGCGIPLKPEGLLNAVDGSNTKRKRAKRSVIDRPLLQCTYCPKAFKKPSELLYHTRSHTGVRPFLCDQCDKSFVSNAHLLRHQRTHSTERRHVCPTCDRGFTQHYGMLVHQLIHSGLKPHKCPDCTRAFRTKGCLGTHRRKRHPEQIAKENKAELQNDPQDSK